MSDYCQDCGQVHPDGTPCEDAAAQLRRLERLRKREIEAIERLSASQDPTKQFISFPRLGANLLPALATVHPNETPDFIALRACSIVEAYGREATKRWAQVAEIASE